jgi:hypothetical protein
MGVIDLQPIDRNVKGAIDGVLTSLFLEPTRMVFDFSVVILTRSQLNSQRMMKMLGLFTVVFF